MHKLPRTKLTLQKRLATLGTLLGQNAPEQKLLKAALRVREARIQVLRAKIGELPSPIRTPAQNMTIEKLDAQIETLRQATPIEILAEVRSARSKATDDC
jgi:hypothetical protein